MTQFFLLYLEKNIFTFLFSFFSQKKSLKSMKAQQATTTTTAQHLSFLLFLLSTLISKVYGLSIETASEFIDFASNVNNGNSNYAGETVYLTNDLDFADYLSSFEPVGKTNEDTNIFRGTFDGQGHAISNLNVSSDKFRFLGVFGYSRGATTKNLVVDESCSFENRNMKNGESSYYSILTGGILGWCESKDGECVVENCVNMAQIKYSGSSPDITYLGGIAGRINPYNYNASIENCVNYGNVSSATPSIGSIRMGGIVGEFWTDKQITFSVDIKNCVNFGALSQSGEVITDLYIGGISAVDKPRTVYEGCVSLGRVSYNESITGDVGAGSISGKSTGGNLTNCFWDESLELDPTGPASEKITTQEGTPSLDLSLFPKSQDVLEALAMTGSIEFAVINLDSNGGSVVGPVLVILNGEAKKGVEPLPTPVREESVFDGWYSDKDLTTPFDSSELAAGNTTLYGKWIVNHYAITFIVDGAAYNKTTQEFGSAIPYPENPTKEGFTFDKWNETLATVPAHNVTIEALWVINHYTITFIVDGAEYNKTTQEFGSAIPYPKKPMKEGFTFDGWYMDSSFKDKANGTAMIVNENSTLYGRFISTTIKIEFNTKDMSTDEAIKKIEEIAGCTDCFKITEFEENGKGIIIIQFNDVSEATNFIETIQK